MFHRSQPSSPWQTRRRAHLIQSNHYHVDGKGLPWTTREETLLHYPPSQVTNPPWMEQNVKVSLGHTGLLLYLDIQWSAVRATCGRFGGSALSMVEHGAGRGAVGLSLWVPVWVQHRQLSAERWHFLVWRRQRLSTGSRSTARLTPCLFTDDIRARDRCHWHFDSPSNVKTSLKHCVMKSL